MRFDEIIAESNRICPQCGMKGCTCKPGYPKKVDEAKRKKKPKKKSSARGYFFPGYGYYGGSGDNSEGGGDGGGESKHSNMNENNRIARKPGQPANSKKHSESCPHCAGPMFSEELMMEKKDACYYKVKSRYKVWPSAYASGALVKCRKKGSKNWGTKSESVEELDENLHQWFKEKWVRFGPDGKIRGDCARGDDSEGKPKCLPQAKAHALGKKGRKYAANKKRREDPDPERSGPAKNVATKKKTNEDVEGNLKEITLTFKTIELSNDNIVSYAKNYFESNNIEAPYQKFISNVKLLSNPKLIESTENAEIQEFLKALTRLDTKKKIKVGDKFAVLSFEIRFAWREIDALGFTEPKEVADIKLHSDGTINYIKFTDGDRYPRLIQATRNNNPIAQAVYFDDKNKAEKALTYLTMIMPDNWEIDLHSLVRQETKKDVAEEQLDELKCWPGYSRVQGVPAGAPGSCKKKTTENVEDSVQIEYWQQDTQESGHWAKTKPMSRDKAEQILSSFPRGEIVDVDQDMSEGETWAKHNNPRAGGMSKKSVSSYRRSHPGSKIQTAVTTKPSKLKKGSKAAARRKSFCARMRGMKKHRTGAKTARDPNSNINKSLRRWHCESVQELQELVMIAEQFIKNNK
jgi:hypothetical protein